MTPDELILRLERERDEALSRIDELEESERYSDLEHARSAGQVYKRQRDEALSIIHQVREVLYQGGQNAAFVRQQLMIIVPHEGGGDDD